MTARGRRVWQFCRGQCGGGNQVGVVDLSTAHWEVMLPSRCPNKDACESKLLAALHITPVVDQAGRIVRP